MSSCITHLPAFSLKLDRGCTSLPSIVPSLVEPCPFAVPICLEKILAFALVVLVSVHALQRGFGGILTWVGVFAVGRASRELCVVVLWFDIGLRWGELVRV